MINELSAPDQWVLLYGDILFRYTVVRVREREIAEDLVQATLLSALKSKENFQGKSTEQTWLIGILKHKIIDHFRKVSRENTVELEMCEIAGEADDYFDQQGHWQVDFSSWSKPDKSMEQDQFMMVLATCIDRLPTKMAQLFVLCEFDNMKTEEICRMMSISTMNNFWVMLSRTRVQLRHCLDIKWIKQ